VGFYLFTVNPTNNCRCFFSSSNFSQYRLGNLFYSATDSCLRRMVVLMKQILINLHQDSFPYLAKKYYINIIQEFSHFKTPEGLLNVTYCFQSGGLPQLTVTGFDNDDKVFKEVWKRFHKVLDEIISSLTLTCDFCGYVMPKYYKLCKRCEYPLRETDK